MLGIDANRKDKTCQAHCLAGDVAEAESAGVGYHTCINEGCRACADFKLVLVHIIERRYHLAGRGTKLLHPFDNAVRLNGNVVVYLDKLAAKGVLWVGNSLKCCGIHNNAKSVRVKLVCNDLTLTAEELKILCIVAVLNVNFLFREALTQNFCQTHCGANCVTVGALVAEDNYSTIFFYFVKNFSCGFKCHFYISLIFF